MLLLADGLQGSTEEVVLERRPAPDLKESEAACDLQYGRFERRFSAESVTMSTVETPHRPTVVDMEEKDNDVAASMKPSSFWVGNGPSWRTTGSKAFLVSTRSATMQQRRRLVTIRRTLWARI